MKFVRNGSTYDYDIKGNGPPVVLLHGFTGSQKTWKSLRDQLIEQFQIITIDLPGHGKTNTNPKTMEQCCEDLSKFLLHINVEHAHFIGYSMGGRVALSFAMFYPGQVTSLVLESSSPGIQSKVEREVRIANDKKLAEKLEFEGLVKFVDFWEDIALFHTQKRLPKETQERIRKERLNQQPNGLANSLRYMGTGMQPSWWDNLNDLACKTLLITGDHDHKFVAINDKMEKLMHDAKHMTITSAGHAIHVEQPKVFAELVRTFLEKQKR